MNHDLRTKVVNSTKWTAITEVMAKLIGPISTMVLARTLTPEAFGVVATIVMVVSFTEIFTNAGFGKYMIQHEFKDDIELEQCSNVAFWSNLTMGLLFWLVIIIFCEQIAALVGSKGYGLGVAVAGVNVPIIALTNIQSSLYSRNFDFKTLFFRRLIGVLIPLVVTIPMAFIFRNYWALLIGTIATNVSNAVFLAWRSTWKPKLYYSWSQFKMMISFSIWSVVEAISIWATNYIDIFIVGSYLSAYYIGIYKTSMSTVGQITGLISATLIPVLFSALSRLQNDEKEFEILLLKFQKATSILVVPIGFGIYTFSEFVTRILLGEQWSNASEFIGLWGLFSTVTILFSYFASEVYRAKGKPRLSVLAQSLHIIFLIPVIWIAVQYDFRVLYISRSYCRLQLVLVDCLIMFFCFRLSIWKMLKNVGPSFFASIVMCQTGFFLKSFSSSVYATICFVAICIIIYFAILLLFKDERFFLRMIMQKGIMKFINK